MLYRVAMSYVIKKTKILKLEFENWKLMVGSRELLIKGVATKGVPLTGKDFAQF